MKPVQKKQGKEIARLFNKLIVAFDMMNDPKCTCNLWKSDLIEARDKLKELGIPVIGYDHYTLD